MIKFTLHKVIQLPYLDLTLAYSKGQGKGHVHLDCEYLQNGDIEGRPWPILKVNVKVMDISTVNISKTVTYGTNITIAVEYEDTLWALD